MKFVCTHICLYLSVCLGEVGLDPRGPLMPSVNGTSPPKRVLDLFEPPRFPLGYEMSRSLLQSPETHKLHHLVLTWNVASVPAHSVQVFGSFTKPPWKTGYDLWWCEVNRFHWIDLHENIPDLSGIIQFKFLVDQKWKCDPSYPICDDGRQVTQFRFHAHTNNRCQAHDRHTTLLKYTPCDHPQVHVFSFSLSALHNLNNVCVIFPHRLRLRLSHQKLRRRTSVREGGPRQNGKVLFCETPQETHHLEEGLLMKPCWASREAPAEALTTPAILSASHRAELTSRWRLASAGSPRAAHFRNRGGHPDFNSPSSHPVRRRPDTETRANRLRRHPIVSGEGPNITTVCRRLITSPSIDHVEAQNMIRGRGSDSSAPVEGLVRCLSHDGSRVKEATVQGISPALRNVAWPHSVTHSLHSPELLLELLLPSNVVKMTKQRLILSSGAFYVYVGPCV